ncbi:Bug family tripartite tricarboxylate transporter substrate binding protein [Streptomyces xinghaiensis]|uniref:Bug family tripartite tricarboxylate transporter substrate binding protein n=1 Tax=Streptomyces xinghaiensis TaxID=1038928 RepID=UPI0034417C0D
MIRRAGGARRARRPGLAAALAAACLLPVGGGCAPGAPAQEPLRLMVPVPAGGGYDYTARTVAVTLRDTGLAGEVEVFNLPGSSGTVALTRLLHETGNDRMLLQMGLGLVGSVLSQGVPHGIDEATPVARLIAEPEAVVVPADSPYASFGELVRAWKESEGSGSGGLVAGIGSRVGGPDHLALMLIAEAVGLAPAEVGFDRYDGGGQMLAPLLGHRVDFALTGVGEYRHAIAAGQLRVLAVTGPRPVSGVDAPTLRGAGYPLEVVNWRGLLAPPGLTERQRAEVTRLLDRLRATPQWQRALRENGWTDAYLTGDRFSAFLAAENRRVGRVVDRLGLAGEADGAG